MKMRKLLSQIEVAITYNHGRRFQRLINIAYRENIHINWNHLLMFAAHVCRSNIGILGEIIWLGADQSYIVNVLRALDSDGHGMYYWDTIYRIASEYPDETRIYNLSQPWLRG